MKNPDDRMARSRADMAYASRRENAAIADAIRKAAQDIKVRVTVQSRTEEYGRNRAVEVLEEIAEEYAQRAEAG